MNTANFNSGLEQPFRKRPTTPQGSAFPEHLRALAECSPDAIFITNLDSAKFVDANASACALFGYSVEEFRQLTGRQLHDESDGAIVDGITRDLLNNQKAFCPSVRLRRKDASFLWATLRSSIYQSDTQSFYVVFIRDISNEQAQRQELESTRNALNQRESQLVQAAHLTTVGKVASGVVHEVNNPAAILQMNLEVLSRRLQNLEGSVSHLRPTAFGRPPLEDNRVRQSLLEGAKENISESFLAVDRMAATMRSLGRVAKTRPSPLVRVDLNEIVHEAISLLGSQLRQDAKIDLQMGQPDYFVGKKERWLQFLINLLLNAHQAVRSLNRRGEIAIVTGKETDGCFLEVTDNGTGVSEEIARRIFEPFVTTHEATGAIGLGLSSCVEIARQHRATLTLLPAETGVRFRVQIPHNTGLSLPQANYTIAPNGWR